ncbi:MAG: S24/S26 family peptidase [Prevotella sp.]|nr:S24/S26 family peptidase [Prevotella sp.]MDY5667471.1 S24/S26 family peptidase [Alloprevotella sp.]
MMEKSRVVEVPNEVLIGEIKRSLQQGHTATFRVKGNSMRPFLENLRDIAKVEAVVPESISEGDVVLAEIAPQLYVLHRVIDRTDNQLTLKGDGNVVGVEHCLDTDVIALATAFYRKGRKKPDQVTSLKWRIYSSIWLTLTPLRRILLAIYRRQPFRL